MASNRVIVNRVYMHHDASPAAGVDILSPSITCKAGDHRWFRVYGTFTQAGKLKVERTVGATTVEETLYGGSDIPAGVAFLQDIPVFSTELINFRHTGGVAADGISYFIVDEYSG